jgi:hypothetical protein
MTGRLVTRRFVIESIVGLPKGSVKERFFVLIHLLYLAIFFFNSDKLLSSLSSIIDTRLST